MVFLQSLLVRGRYFSLVDGLKTTKHPLVSSIKGEPVIKKTTETEWVGDRSPVAEV
jgi:hypothetical protein